MQITSGLGPAGRAYLAPREFLWIAPFWFIACTSPSPLPFHYLFPQLTMGLAPLIVVLKTLGLRRNDADLQPGRALLGAHFRHQLRDGRGDRHSHGISVRHQLVALLALCRRRDRPDAGHGRHVRFLPGVGVPRVVPLRREAARLQRALVVGDGGISGLVAFGLLHHRHRRLDAASRGLRQSRRRIGAAHQLLGTGPESLGLVAVCAQHERRRRSPALSSWRRWARSICCGASSRSTGGFS